MIYSLLDLSCLNYFKNNNIASTNSAISVNELLGNLNISKASVYRHIKQLVDDEGLNIAFIHGNTKKYYISQKGLDLVNNKFI